MYLAITVEMFVLSVIVPSAVLIVYGILHTIFAPFFK